MATPRAYFLTWTTYGTWLPGDDRGWMDKRDPDLQPPDPQRQSAARGQMKGQPIYLESSARGAVVDGIRKGSSRYGWTLHALEVRRSHVHVVVSAGNVPAGRVLGMLKAAASKELNLLRPSCSGNRWWTRDGSKRYLNDEKALMRAIEYTRQQDTSWMKHEQSSALSGESTDGMYDCRRSAGAFRPNAGLSALAADPLLRRGLVTTNLAAATVRGRQ